MINTKLYCKQAQAWGAVGEQQTLQPAVEQLKQQLTTLNSPKFIARQAT
jgi:hypothetical protein